MGRRIVAIICIMFLIITTISPISGSIFSYADEGLDDQQKAALAMSSYFNYRKGWYVGSTASAVSLMKSYIDDFFSAPANNTGINSYSEFASHIDVGRDNNDHWGVTIDNTGLVFLDHLAKWLLGKNKFPNLYSGGSWGTTSSSQDNIYNGYLKGNDLFYIINSANVESYVGQGTEFQIYDSIISVGSPVNGVSSEFIKNYYLNANPNFNILDNEHEGSRNNGYLNVQWAADVSYRYTIYGYYSTNNNYSNFYGENSYPAICNASGNFLLYANRVNAVRGNAAWIIDRNNPTKVYAGFVSYNYGLNKYYIDLYREVSNKAPVSSLTPADVDFNSNDFDKSDVGQADQNGAPVQNAPSKTFTPEYTTNEGDTYYYYTNQTINNFYNEYIDNYTYNTNNEYNNTVINNNTTPDDPDDPETPGGTTPPWDSSSGSGTITPDGNGGYNFNLPDLTIPDLNIDWSINGLKDKFPFSIPWDLMAFFTVLNAEPETPEFTGEVDLGISIWNIDIDLHDFDLVAALVRNLEFIAFCIGLIIVTRSIIKG